MDDATPRYVERLDELSAMQDGWLDGDGIAPYSDVVESTKTLLGALPSKLAQNAYLYPTFEGGIECAWCGVDWVVELYVNYNLVGAQGIPTITYDVGDSRQDNDINFDTMKETIEFLTSRLDGSLTLAVNVCKNP